MIDTLIFPSDYFNKNSVDSLLADEYISAEEINSFRIILFDQQKWFDEGELYLSKKLNHPSKAIYRGWMMKPALYTEFYKKLLEKGVELLTTPESYNLMHSFVNVFPYLKDDTPRIMTYPLYERINVSKIKENFDRFMVKDYVKSVKGAGLPNYFDSSVTQAEFDSYMEKFYEYRGDLLTGGICIKEYVDLKTYQGITNEHRAFYLNGKLMLIGQNSQQVGVVNNPPEELVLKYQNLNSPFYTIDFAELSSGEWVILETGDGGVSGLAESTPADVFYNKLAEMLSC